MSHIPGLWAHDGPLDRLNALINHPIKLHLNYPLEWKFTSLVPGLYLLFRVTRWIGAQLINLQEDLGQWRGFLLMGVTP